MSSTSAPNRRSFLARGAAVAAVPAVAALAGGALAEPASADTLPDYAPIPPSALGPAVNAQGYFVGRVEKNLYWVTDGTYQAAFLTTRDGVVLFDAPPSIGHNLQRAIDEIAVRQRRVQQGDPHRLLAPPRRPPGRLVAVRPQRGPDRPRRDQAAAGPGQRPDPARARRHLRDPLHAARRRGADRPGLARHQPHPRQHLHPLPRPRHAHARRHRPARLGAVRQLQPERGRPRLHRRPGHGHGLPVEALHRRPHGPARHPRRHGRVPAVRRRPHRRTSRRPW